MTVLPLQVLASTDDANETDGSGAMQLTGSQLAFGKGGFSASHVGLRFTGVSGLAGATINAATVLTFNAAQTGSGSFVGDWFAHDDEAPGTLTSTAFNITDTGQRPRTTATCEGDGVDFGNWTSGSDETFTGDGVNDIADIIQELATDYDPSAIVLLHIYSSGTGRRNCRTYDLDTSLAPKLDIDYTAATGDQTATPAPVTMPLVVPAPTLTPGPVTISPTPAVMTYLVPVPDVQAGPVTISPDPVVMPLVLPAPTLTPGPVTISPAPVAMPLLVPDPNVTGAGAVTISPSPVTMPLIVPDPTLTVGPVTLNPTPVTMPLVVPAPALHVALTPSPVAMPLLVPVPSLGAGAVTLSPVPVAMPLLLPTPSIIGAGTQFTQWGKVERLIDPGEYTPGTVFLIEIGMFTQSALVPVEAHLFNVTDGLIVVGSEVSGTATAYEVLRSGTFSLPAGLKKYRLDYGGEIGGIYFFHGGDVHPVSS